MSVSHALADCCNCCDFPEVITPKQHPKGLWQIRCAMCGAASHPYSTQDECYIAWRNMNVGDPIIVEFKLTVNDGKNTQEITATKAFPAYWCSSDIDDEFDKWKHRVLVSKWSVK